MLNRELQPSISGTAAGPVRSVLYARVSSKEQELGYSIPAQQQLLRDYGVQHDFTIEQEFVDVETAKAVGRPGFAAMVDYLKKHPVCRIVLVEKTDRLYRNYTDSGAIEALDIEIHLVKENQILSKASRASDKFMHGINVLKAKNYIDNLSEEVRKGMRTKAAQNLWPSFAPLGYKNVIGPDQKRIIVPDAVLGPLVTTLFEWFATEEYSLKGLGKKAYDEGFRFRKSRGKIPVSTLHKLLRKRIYMGEFDYAGQRYQGSHEPLVSREVWDRVQEILDGRRARKHRKVTHEFVYSGLIRCGHCGCSLVGEVKKGKYVYYHCTGYRGNCGEPYVREETLRQHFAAGLKEVVLSAPILRWLEEELAEAERAMQAARSQELQRHQTELERLQQRLDTMYEDRLDGRIDTATYDHRADDIRQQQERTRDRIRGAEAIASAPAAQATELETITKRAAELFLNQPAAEQRRLLHLVVEDASWKNGELQMLLRAPFEALRTPNGAVAEAQRLNAGVPEGMTLRPAA